ncbi:AlbA family DNA-binding domain-containing protein [Nitrosomonas mobilis]|uniref:Schlafen AlbA-2 domain-containing protein n=1 Tax=Nitrosomonas mobilis TaxID=51642 RepID=A0A1G5SG23_9PROT|nr:ATP-binding protein [Nitrosomonas mobilis]SCZ86146.1 hypothetical protein NSMM_490035 [Nitrosomonas mobilis]
MAFPTTRMSGYIDLNARISLALSRCQEQPWPKLCWRLLKTIMGMANLRDGGLILIGVGEKGTTWELTGIDPAHLTTFDYDNIIDQLSKYASPQINMDIVLHDHDDGKRYLTFHVHQFNDSPVVCRKNSPNDLKPKDQFSAGDVYVRPTIGKPQTVRVTDAARLHDLLELASEFRARRMLEVGKRVGLVPAESSKTKYEAELATVEGDPVPIKTYPFWRVQYHPEFYDSDLIPTLSDCFRLVEKSRVQFRGWDFPHLARSSDSSHGVVRGSQSIGSWANFMGSMEYWYLFQSGQFVHFSALREATETEWRDKLQQATKSHLGRLGSVDWDTVPGYISLVNLIYTVTEYFEFAARICQAGVYKGNLDIDIGLTGVKGYMLTTDWDRMWSQNCVASEDNLSKTWKVSSESLVSESLEHSLKAIVWLVECLGWLSPNEESIRSDQKKLISGRL